MLYEIELTNKATKLIGKLELETQIDVMSAINELAENPRPHGCESVQAIEGIFRIRVGSYRIFYKIDGGKLIVIGVAVYDRKDAYKKIKRIKL